MKSPVKKGDERQSDGRLSRALDDIVRQCVRCGLCNASCPTYQLEFDERDGPRGRIALMGEMFARGGSPTETERRHIGRCLSCMACVSACPADVDYDRLVTHAKSYIRAATSRTPGQRALDRFVEAILPHPRRLNWMMAATPLASGVSRLLRLLGLRDLSRMIEVAPRFAIRRAAFAGPGVAATKRERRGRVILLAGCAQQVLRPSINDATIRLLGRSGIDVEVVAGVGCCGAAAVGAGDVEGARRQARANIDAWGKALGRVEADAIITNSAGCGKGVKDYGRLLENDPAYAEQAAEIAALARDVTEFIAEKGLGPPRRWSSLKVGYQASCHLRHGQQIAETPADLIHQAGFTVVQDAHDNGCCGAAGTYAFASPDISRTLRDAKISALLASQPDVIATGSIACLVHLEAAVDTPIVHIIELLDWAHGGPVPPGLGALAGEITEVPGPQRLDVEDFIRA